MHGACAPSHAHAVRRCLGRLGIHWLGPSAGIRRRGAAWALCGCCLFQWGDTISRSGRPMSPPSSSRAVSMVPRALPSSGLARVTLTRHTPSPCPTSQISPAAPTRIDARTARYAAECAADSLFTALSALTGACDGHDALGVVHGGQVCAQVDTRPHSMAGVQTLSARRASTDAWTKTRAAMIAFAAWTPTALAERRRCIGLPKDGGRGSLSGVPSFVDFVDCPRRRKPSDPATSLRAITAAAGRPCRSHATQAQPP